MEKEKVLAALMKALADHESGAAKNPLSAINPHTKAYGIWQIKPSNIPYWWDKYVVAKGRGQKLSKTDLMKAYSTDPNVQQTLVAAVLSDEYDKLASRNMSPQDIVQQLAGWWYSGRYWNQFPTKKYRYGDTTYPSIKEYVNSVTQKAFQYLNQGLQTTPPTQTTSVNNWINLDKAGQNQSNQTPQQNQPLTFSIPGTPAPTTFIPLPLPTPPDPTSTIYNRGWLSNMLTPLALVQPTGNPFFDVGRQLGAMLGGLMFKEIAGKIMYQKDLERYAAQQAQYADTLYKLYEKLGNKSVLQPTQAGIAVIPRQEIETKVNDGIIVQTNTSTGETKITQLPQSFINNRSLEYRNGLLVDTKTGGIRLPTGANGQIVIDPNLVQNVSNVFKDINNLSVQIADQLTNFIKSVKDINTMSVDQLSNFLGDQLSFFTNKFKDLGLEPAISSTAIQNAAAEVLKLAQNPKFQENAIIAAEQTRKIINNLLGTQTYTLNAENGKVIFTYDPTSGVQYKTIPNTPVKVFDKPISINKFDFDKPDPIDILNFSSSLANFANTLKRTGLLNTADPVETIYNMLQNKPVLGQYLNEIKNYISEPDFLTIVENFQNLSTIYDTYQSKKLNPFFSSMSNLANITRNMFQKDQENKFKIDVLNPDNFSNIDSKDLENLTKIKIPYETIETLKNKSSDEIIQLLKDLYSNHTMTTDKYGIPYVIIGTLKDSNENKLIGIPLKKGIPVSGKTGLDFFDPEQRTTIQSKPTKTRK